MEKTILMIRPEQRIKLMELATKEHVSAAEITRRAIDAYNPDELNDEELEQLLEIVMQSRMETLETLNETKLAILLSE